MLAHASAVVRCVRTHTVRRILAHRIQARYPTLDSDPTAIWDYGYRDIDAIQLGTGVMVRAFVEIIVHRSNRYTSIEGGLTIGNGSTLATGANIRAAGGVISIGDRTTIGQHSVLVAANHTVKLGLDYFNTPYDESRTGITIGTNVWVAAQCVVLPGVSIGDNSLIAAGSVVTRSVPANEVWAGVPARRVRVLS